MNEHVKNFTKYFLANPYVGALFIVCFVLFEPLIAYSVQILVFRAIIQARFFLHKSSSFCCGKEGYVLAPSVQCIPLNFILSLYLHSLCLSLPFGNETNCWPLRGFFGKKRNGCDGLCFHLYNAPGFATCPSFLRFLGRTMFCAFFRKNWPFSQFFV